MSKKRYQKTAATADEVNKENVVDETSEEILETPQTAEETLVAENATEDAEETLVDTDAAKDDVANDAEQTTEEDDAAVDALKSVDAEVEQKDGGAEVDEEPSGAEAEGEEVSLDRSEDEVCLESDEEEIEAPENKEKRSRFGAPVKKKARLKEGMSKKKKIIIAAIALAAIVVVTLSITLPLVFYYKDKVMVASAEDFANFAKGKYFVLEKDVTVEGDLDLSGCNYSIDLGKHTLVVKGTLTYATSEEKTIEIGRYKGKQFIIGGSLQVGALKVDAPNATVRIVSPLQGGDIAVKAKSAEMGGTSYDQGFLFENTDVVLGGDVVGGATAEDIAFINSHVIIKGKLNGSANLQSSDAVMNESSTAVGLKLDAVSTLQLSGKISNGVDGGAKVSALGNFECPRFENVALLAIKRDGDYTAVNCAKLIYVDTLDTPLEVTVEERGGKIIARAAGVINAVEYVFLIDGVAQNNVGEECDITLQILGLVGEHTIGVYAKGNYSFDALESYDFGDGDIGVMYLDGASASVKYTYSIVLEKPANLIVSDGKVQFANVPFADYYSVVIDGVSVDFKDVDKSKPTQSFDISGYLASVGNHSVKVIARSNNKDVKESAASVVYSATRATLSAAQNVTAGLVFGEATQSDFLSVSWDAVESAAGYYVYYKDESGAEVIISRTSRTSIGVDTAMLGGVNLEGKQIYVRAIGSGYYNDAAESAAVVERAD